MWNKKLWIWGFALLFVVPILVPRVTPVGPGPATLLGFVTFVLWLTVIQRKTWAKVGKILLVAIAIWIVVTVIVLIVVNIVLYNQSRRTDLTLRRGAWPPATAYGFPLHQLKGCRTGLPM